MINPNDAAAFLAVLAGQIEALPPDFVLPSGAKETTSFLAEVGADKLLEASNEILAGQLLLLRPTVLVLLQQAAHDALAQSRQAEALSLIERLHALNPDDVGVRIWLASSLDVADQSERIVALFEPIIDQMIANPEAFAPYYRIIVPAAMKCRRIDVVDTLGRNRPVRKTHAEAATKAVYDRANDLAALGLAVGDFGSMSNPLEAVVAEAMLTLDEYGLLQKIDVIATMSRTETSGIETSRHVLSIAGLAYKKGWSRPYRKSLQLASVLSTVEGSCASLERWTALGLPEQGHHAFTVATVAKHGFREMGWQHDAHDPEASDKPCVGCRDPEPRTQDELQDKLEAFPANPTIKQAETIWSAAYSEGHHELVARYAPSSSRAESFGARARAVVDAPPERGGETPLWILMPWLKDADRLLRVMTAYVGQSTIVVSIGGDGVPADLASASALLLVDDVHLFSRPVVTWGGQKGAHHNFLDVMKAFSASAPKGAWLQTLCDRTYPLQNLQRFKRWTASIQGLSLTFGFGPPGWKFEWPDEVVSNLASRYHSALDEVFRTGLATEFHELATKSALYGDNDMRLVSTSFNFDSKAKSVDPGMWHQYMISPYEIDVRWMSFARLQAFIEVGVESRTTYTRRHHPLVTQWVQDVLVKYDLRIGSNWAYMSRHYVDSVLSHPGLPELFSALDLGFAPEMNFFDSMGATLQLDSDFAHLFHVFPENDALDKELANACVSADRDEFAFVRKTNPVDGREFIRFFAQRIFEDDVSLTIHWAVKCRSLPADERDPRPVLDGLLIERLVNSRVCIRDLFGRSRLHARFLADGTIQETNGSTLANWTFESGEIRVKFVDAQFGDQTFKSIGGSPRSFTLAPLSLVGNGNRWGVFLDFDLDDVSNDPSVRDLVVGLDFSLLKNQTRWIGSGQPAAALLTALSSEQSNFPTPTVEADGCLHEMRQTADGVLALVTLNGFPSLLDVTGFAQTRTSSIIEFERSGDSAIDTWNSAVVVAAPTFTLLPTQLVGRWSFSTLHETYPVELGIDEGIRREDGAIVGRWIVRQDGLQLFGLSGMVIGLADNIRLNRGSWRLSGWGWRNMKDSVTFSLTACFSNPRTLLYAPSFEAVLDK